MLAYRMQAAAFGDLDRAILRRLREQLAKLKGGRARDWFTLPDDVPCADLSLEIETPEGWREIAHDDLKRQYEDLEVAVGDRLIRWIRFSRDGAAGGGREAHFFSGHPPHPRG